MAVEVFRLEPHLYLNIPSRLLTLDELKGAVQTMIRLATEYGEQYYVVVSDATDLTSMPFNIRLLREIADWDRRMIALLLVNPPYIATIAAGIISRVSALAFEHYETRDTGLERAHAILRTKADELCAKEQL